MHGNSKKKFFIFIILVILLECGCSTKQEQIAETKWIYDTNAYLSYRRMSLLCKNSYEWDSSLIEQTDETEWIYKIDNISVKIEVHDAISDYEITYDNSALAKISKEFLDDPVGIVVYYVDINNDWSPDVVIVGDPPRGTLTGPHWIYAYDVKNRIEITLFDENGYLTQTQKSQMNELLTEDFYTLFKEAKEIGFAGGSPYIDSFGNVYYEMGIMDLRKNIGDILLFLSFDKEAGNFQVTELQYMPLYVTE